MLTCRAPAHAGSSGRLRLVNLIAFGQRDPKLFAAGPEMRRRAQPGGVVQRAGPHAAQALIRSRRAANPTTALRADPAGLDAAAVRDCMHKPRLDSRQVKGPVVHRDRDRKRATRQALAIGAVAGVSQLRCFGDFVANLAAKAAAGLWKFHWFPPHSAICAAAFAAPPGAASNRETYHA